MLRSGDASTSEGKYHDRFVTKCGESSGQKPEIPGFSDTPAVVLAVTCVLLERNLP